MKYIKWLMNKKVVEEELDRQDRMIDNLRTKIAKLHETEEINNYLSEQSDKNILTIKEQRKEINKMKKQMKFLIERDSKLQEIEFAIANKKTFKEVKEILKKEK